MKGLNHLLALGLVVALSGCSYFQGENSGSSGDEQSGAGAKTAVAELKPSKAATTQPTMNNVHGTITLKQQGNTVRVSGKVMGLPPNSTHGFHIHEKGDLSAPDLASAGPHYNPEQHPHAGVDAPHRHAGDLGNITTDAQGTASVDVVVDNISLGGPKNDVIGKAMLVHAKQDDLKTQPSGDAGARVAGGVIEMK